MGSSVVPFDEIINQDSRFKAETSLCSFLDVLIILDASESLSCVAKKRSASTPSVFRVYKYFWVS